MFQPKRTFHHEENLDFWVSPRMHIRYIRGWLTGVLYCDCFQIETILIAKEVGGPWNTDGVNKPYGIEFEMRVRLQMIKSFVFEWVLKNGFENACKTSRDVCFRPYIEKSLLFTMQENLSNKLYLKYTTKFENDEE